MQPHTNLNCEHFASITLAPPLAEIRPIAESIVSSIPLGTTVLAYGKSDHVYLAVGSTRSIRFQNGIISLSNKDESNSVHVGSDCWDALSSFLADAHSSKAPVFGYVGHGALESDAQGDIPAIDMFIPETVFKISSLGGKEKSELIWGSTQYSGQLTMKFLDTCWGEPTLRAEDLNLVEERLSRVLTWINVTEGQHQERAATVSGRFHLEDFSIPLDMVFSSPITPHPAYRSFYARFPSSSLEFVGHCPETLIHTEEGLLTSFKLSGTLPIGDSEEAAKNQIKTDPKLIAEHEGSITGYVSALQSLGEVHRSERDILTLRSLLHFVSRIDTQINPSTSPVEIIKTTLPSGARPRLDGLRIIREIETEPRGPYYGLVGMITPHGEMDFTQVLRTVFKVNSNSFIQAGANVSGATAQYWPIRLEAEEVFHKASSVHVPENCKED